MDDLNRSLYSLRARMRRRTTLLNKIATAAGNNGDRCPCCAETFALAVEALNYRPEADAEEAPDGADS